MTEQPHNAHRVLTSKRRKISLRTILCGGTRCMASVLPTDVRVGNFGYGSRSIGQVFSLLLTGSTSKSRGSMFNVQHSPLG